MQGRTLGNTGSSMLVALTQFFEAQGLEQNDWLRLRQDRVSVLA
jgi:hypothetical protein